MIKAAQNTQGSPIENSVFLSVERLLSLRKLGAEVKLLNRKRTQSSVDGSLATRFRGRGMEFAEVRPYTAGDDIRTIDWRVTARTQVTHTKLFQEERERPVFVIVDQRSPMFFGTQTVFKSVYAAELAATIAWAALANGDRIGGSIFSDTQTKDLRPKRGKHALLEFMHQLKEFNHHLSSPLVTGKILTLEDQLTDMLRIAKPGSAIYVISDFHDFNITRNTNQRLQHKALAGLAKHNDVTLMRIFDPLEAALPHNKLCAFTDGETKLRVDTGRRMRSQMNIAQEYAASFTQRGENLYNCAKQSGAYAVDINISEALEKSVPALFVSNRSSRGAR